MKSAKTIILFIFILFLISLYRCLPPEKITLPGDLTGYVTDEETSLPIQAATVKLDPSDDTASTGSDGKFLFKNLVPDNYEVEVSKPAYFKDTKNATVNEANTTEIDFALSGAPSPEFSDSCLDFGFDSTVKSFTISNAGKGELRYSISTSQGWINVDPDKGEVTTETNTINVTINRTGLSENKQEEKITILSYIGEGTQQDQVDVLVNGVADQDGNYYGIVTIGTQTWMAENLNTGIIFYSGTGSEPTNNPIVEKYCYLNLKENCDIYGGLYTWPEMMNYGPPDNETIGTTQGICPAGWHIPTSSEWDMLIDYCGGSTYAGGALKAQGNLDDGDGLWEYPNTGATDQYGFRALPGGAFAENYDNPGEWNFFQKGEWAGFWTSYSGAPELTAGHIVLDFQSEDIFDTYGKSIKAAISVRCIKDPL